MSDCCKHCTYSKRRTVGEIACPFNALYWDFLARNKEKLKDNPRMNLVLAQLGKREPQDLAATRKRASQIRNRLRNAERM